EHGARFGETILVDRGAVRGRRTIPTLLIHVVHTEDALQALAVVGQIEFLGPVLVAHAALVVARLRNGLAAILRLLHRQAHEQRVSGAERTHVAVARYRVDLHRVRDEVAHVQGDAGVIDRALTERTVDLAARQIAIERPVGFRNVDAGGYLQRDRDTRFRIILNGKHRQLGFELLVRRVQQLHALRARVDVADATTVLRSVDVAIALTHDA